MNKSLETKIMKTPKKIMDAARDEECTFRIPEYCNENPETTVACHLPDGSGGSNRLTGPLSIAFGCSGCHDAIDGKVPTYEQFPNHKEFYIRRGMMRTMTRLVDRGILKW